LRMTASRALKGIVYLALAAVLVAIIADTGNALEQKYIPIRDKSRAPVIPEPMTLDWKVSTTFPLLATVSIVAPAASSEETRELAYEIREAMRVLWGVQPEVLFTDLIPERNAIVMGTLEDDSLLAALVPKIPREQFGKHYDQGYVISSSPDRVVVLGMGAKGLKYGAQTFLQLVTSDLSIRNHAFPAVEVVDYPAFKMRALMLPFGSYQQLSQIAIVRDLIGVAEMLHFNTIFLQVNNATIFDSLPELARPGATPKDTLRDVVQYARELGMEVIPLVSLFSRQASLLCAMQSPLCLDNDTYNPDNPKVYDKLFGILDEVIEIFEPKYMHVGHDEIMPLANMPAEEARRLFLKDVLLIHDYLQNKDVQMMMWADMVLYSQQFRGQDNCRGRIADLYTVIDSLPRDIIFVDAHYKQRSPEYQTIDYLVSKGFQVAGCVAGDTTIINNFSKYAARSESGVLGMILPFWDCFKYGPFTSNRRFVWYGAQAFWRGGIPPEDPLGRRRPPGLRDFKY